MRLACLFSGGKDSCLALHLARKKHEVVYLLSVVPENEDSFMFHKPDMNLLRRQAEELGIELRICKSKGEREKELSDLRDLILEVRDDIEGIVVGGIASSYQGERIKKICDEIDLKFVAPLWNYAPEEIWEMLLGDGFEVVLTKISCEGLGREWIGKKIGKREVEELKKLSKRFGFRMDFEGGEAESAVLWMPGFKKHINIDYDIVSEGKYRHFMRINSLR